MRFVPSDALIPMLVIKFDLSLPKLGYTLEHKNFRMHVQVECCRGCAALLSTHDQEIDNRPAKSHGVLVCLFTAASRSAPSSRDQEVLSYRFRSHPIIQNVTDEASKY